MNKIVDVLKLAEYVGNINIAMHVVGRTQRYIIDSPKRIYADNKDIFFRDFGYWPRNLEFHIIALRNRFLFRVQIFHKYKWHFWLTTPSYCTLVDLLKYVDDIVIRIIVIVCFEKNLNTKYNRCKAIVVMNVEMQQRSFAIWNRCFVLISIQLKLSVNSWKYPNKAKYCLQGGNFCNCCCFVQS